MPDDSSSGDTGGRLWRGLRGLLFGEDSEPTLRDQIEEAIEEHEGEAPSQGDLSPVERQMLRNLLHFGERTAGDIGVPRADIIAVAETISFADLVAAFADAGHSRLPVYRDSLDSVIGMIHIKDVFAILAERRGRTPTTLDGLIRQPRYVPESMGVLDLLAEMRATAPIWRSCSTNIRAPRGSSRSRIWSRRSSARSRTSMTRRRARCSSPLDGGAVGCRCPRRARGCRRDDRPAPRRDRGGCRYARRARLGAGRPCAADRRDRGTCQRLAA